MVTSKTLCLTSHLKCNLETADHISSFRPIIDLIIIRSSVKKTRKHSSRLHTNCLPTVWWPPDVSMVGGGGRKCTVKSNEQV